MSERQGKFTRVQRILIWAVFPVLLPSRWKSTGRGPESGINTVTRKEREHWQSLCWERLLGLIWLS